MPLIECEVGVRAPAERCFDLARSVDLHVDSSVEIRGRATGGRVSGLSAAGDATVWSARFLGIRSSARTRIEGFDRPTAFRDVMTRGLLRRFEHRYRFTPTDAGCRMSDELWIEAPLGALGRVAERAYLVGRMEHLVRRRLAWIRAVAEGDDWRRYLLPTAG